jgi:hypothetical protein
MDQIVDKILIGNNKIMTFVKKIIRSNFSKKKYKC